MQNVISYKNDLKELKKMKTFALVLIALGLAILLSACGIFFTRDTDSTTRKIADKYGGVYVFDKAIRDEIIQREKERDTYMDDWFKTHEFFTKDDLAVLDKTLPQTLSNGCEYFISGNNITKKGRNFNFKGEKEFEFYENKIREYTGDEIYKKIKPYLGVRSYYECQGKRYPLTIKVDIPEVVTTYGLYGDEGRGFSLTRSYVRGISGDNIFYLENGRFIKSDERGEGKDW